MATTTVLDIVSEQLGILEDHHVLASAERQIILDKLKKEPDKLKEYSDSFSKGLPGVTKGVIGAIKAGKSGDPYAISIATVDIFASIVTMAGPLLGPGGPLVSALAGMLSTILGEFLPKPPSLKEEIEKLLNKFLAEEKLRDLGTALDQIWVLSDTIQHHSLDYKSLNLQHGTEIKAIDDAWQWLNQKDKQAVPEWGEVLEKTCMVWIQLLRCVALSVVKPSTRKGVEKGEMLVYLPARQELFLKYLRSIKPVAQERGLYVEMQAWDNFGNVLYVAPGQKGSLPWDYKKNTQWMKNFSIHVSSDQAGSPTPSYEVISCVDRPAAIVRYMVDAATGDLYDGKQLMSEGEDYSNIGGGTRKFVDCVCAWALTDDDPGAIRIYTAHRAGRDSYVNIHVVDSDDRTRRINWEPHAAEGLAHIRAVRRDITQSLPDDPDTAGLPSRSWEIIYGGYLDNGRIWVEADNSWTDIPSPWDRYNGIEVDPYCLWVFGEHGLACATHASVMQCKKGTIGSPGWITFKTDWSDGFNVRTLSPCEDGILAVGSDQPMHGGLVLWTGDYRIDLEERKIEWKYDGSPRGGGNIRPKQILKMPIACWPVFMQVKRDLEKQVGQGHAGS